MAKLSLDPYNMELMKRGIGGAPMTRKEAIIASGKGVDPSTVTDNPITYMDDLKRFGINIQNILKAGGLSQANLPATSQGIEAAVKKVTEAGGVKEGKTPDDFVPFDPTTLPNVKIFESTPGPEGPKLVEDLSNSALGSKVIPSDLAGGRGTVIEKPGDRTNLTEMQGGLKSQPVIDLVAGQGQDNNPNEDASTTAFMAGMDEFINAARGAAPDAPSVKSIEDYKRTFAEATGIDISGKPDKSSALMALGLALMQNRAGSGFNVGNILRAVGQAGEVALPKLEAAKKEAKEAQFLAGQYALQEQKNDIANQRAAAQADKDFNRDLYLKWYQSQLDRKLENDKNNFELKKAGTDPKKFNKKHEFTFATGQGDSSSWKIPVVYDENSPNSGIILKPVGMARKYVDGREGVGDAIDLIQDMRQAALEIKEGGGTAKFAFDKLNSISKALFPDLNTGEASAEQKYNQGINMIMGRFKRFLTQETGNGISNRDVEIWENEIMKKPNWFTNFDETNAALNNLEDIFSSKLAEYDAGLDFIFDPENLKPEDFEELTEEFGDVEDIKSGGGLLVFQDGKLIRKGQE